MLLLAVDAGPLVPEIDAAGQPKPAEAPLFDGVPGVPSFTSSSLSSEGS